MSYGALATHNEGGIHIFTSASKLGASLGAWMLHGLGSGNPSLPGHVMLTGRAEGDRVVARLHHEDDEGPLAEAERPARA